jgi:uncharacterized protein with ParB-like and HNH nuclease domain
MEVKDVFEAYPKSIEQLLGDKGAGFYIPVYQREYAWPPEMVSTLIGDCLLGLTHLVDQSDSITFIGSSIVIKDNRHETIHPMSKGDLPQGVYLLIDGQQRLTTISLICTVLHSMLSNESVKLSKNTDDESNWLLNQIQRLSADLEETFLIDQNYPRNDPEMRFYPKIIRALHDCWSREKSLAHYSSPIGNFLHQYIKHIKGSQPNEEFIYNQPSDEEKYTTIANILALIRKEIDNITRIGNEDFTFPHLSDVIRSKSIVDVVFNGVIPDEVCQKLSSEESTSEIKRFRKVFRLVTFGSFVLRRIAITEVIVKNEDYAFDMFEALNTTGEPLTAFETFKPEIIKEETLKNWENSPSFEFVEKIEKLLNQHEKAESKQNATSDLLIPFRLSESGGKLTKKLNEQRKYLIKQYQIFLQTKEEKRDFVKALSEAADFCNFVWPSNSGLTSTLGENIVINDDDFLLCINLLRKSKHEITMGVLMRYYSHYVNGNTSQKVERYELFKNVVKATAAFYVFWRSSRSTTDSIDSHYRTLMLSGFKDEDYGIDIKPLARTKNNGIVLSLDEIQSAYKYILATKSKIVKISNKTDWLTHASQTSVYSISGQISKFILLAAYNDTTSREGKLEKGRKGIFPVLKNDYFVGNMLTVEHIAPQTPDRISGVWDWRIYDINTNMPNSLGNLTLLPQIENSSIGNASWKHKKVFYRALACDTIEDQKKILKEAEKDNISFKESTISVLNDSSHLPFLSSIVQVEDFDEQYVSQRSNNIVDLAWEEISKWLNY